MIIQLTDDFNLDKIADSGQCFRIRKFESGMFRFITKDHILYISRTGEDTCSVSCTEDEWSRIWTDYFDLKRSYGTIRQEIPASDPFLTKAAEEGAGIRILAQDHWETLISFIISQRKSIPAIKSSIELLSSRYGTSISTPYETVFTFPTPEQLSGITMEDLASCKVGYRAGYIQDAVQRALSGSLPLTEWESCSDQELSENLMQIYGVGKKVANCVCLFSFSRTSLAPVDTWIQKIIDHYYQGENIFLRYDNAGILQQYMFFYALKHKKECDHAL